MTKYYDGSLPTPNWGETQDDANKRYILEMARTGLRWPEDNSPLRKVLDEYSKADWVPGEGYKGFTREYYQIVENVRWELPHPRTGQTQDEANEDYLLYMASRGQLPGPETPLGDWLKDQPWDADRKLRGQIYELIEDDRITQSSVYAWDPDNDGFVEECPVYHHWERVNRVKGESETRRMQVPGGFIYAVMGTPSAVLFVPTPAAVTNAKDDEEADLPEREQRRKDGCPHG